MTTIPGDQLYVLDNLRRSLSIWDRMPDVMHRLSPDLGETINEIVSDMATLENDTADLDPYDAEAVSVLADRMTLLADRLTGFTDALMAELASKKIVA